MHVPLLSDKELSALLFRDIYGTYSDFRHLNSPIRVYLSTRDERSALFFSKYEHVKRILSEDCCVSKDSFVNTSIFIDDDSFLGSILFQDNPEHDSVKDLFFDFFKKTPISRFWELCKNSSDLCLKSAWARRTSGQLNLMEDFAFKLPLFVMMNVLGFPNEKMNELDSLSNIIHSGSDGISAPHLLKKAKKNATAECLDLLTCAAKGEWQAGKGTLLVEVEDFVRSQKISPEVAAANLLLLLFAGHETTSALIGSLFYCLASFPDQLQRLLRNSNLMDSAIDEVLRFESPLQRSTFRCATKAFSFDGLTIDKGEELYAFIGAANRDECVFSNASLFDVSRRPNPYLSFGKGSHHCLGRHLAILEAKAAFNSFLTNFPGIVSINICSSRWSKSTFMRNLDLLMLSFE